jgi:hypothetical protein
MLIQRRDKSPGHCAMIVEWVTYLDRVVDHHDEAVGLWDSHGSFLLCRDIVAAAVVNHYG